MRIRWLAGALIVLVATYFVMRALATACTGAACDAYIPVSLLIPLLIIAMAAVTGIAAAASARGTTWFVWLVVSTLLGVVGPIIGLLVFKDSPDTFVATGTVLELQVALVALAYTFIRTGATSAR